MTNRNSGGLLLCAAALSIAATTATAAGYERELVPEFNGFLKLSDTTRLYFLAAVTRGTKEEVTDGEAGVHFDVTLKPILRQHLRNANWERERYLWMRVGYVRLGDLDGRADGFLENRLVLETTGRVPLPGETWLVNRLRLDLRDVDGKDSTRFRYRLGIERELKMDEYTLVPYAQAEWFRDSRFDEWNRTLYQVGIEIELDARRRIEPYYARQVDDRSSPGRVDRFGLVLKHYW